MQRYLRRSPPLLALLVSLWSLGCGSDEGGESPPTGNTQAGKGGSSSGGSGGSSAGQAGSSNAGTSGQAGSSGAAQAGAGGSVAGQGGSGGEAGSGGSEAGQGGESGTSGQAGSEQGGAGLGGAGGSDAGAGGSDAGQGGDAGSGQGGEAGASGQGGGTSCPTGDLCEGGICAGGACCKASLACNDACCQQGQLCSFGACVNPGKGCFDSSDCAGNEYCERGGSEPGSGGQGGQCSGGSGATGVCLPLPPICAEGESGVGPNGQITCLQKCEVKPSPKPFEVELKYAWGGEITPPYSSDVMMTPIVIQLDDDDCDGKVTERDIPEIVFTTFAGGAYTQAGTLHAISIVDGKVIDKWSVPGIIAAAGELAAGNIDGEPGNEVVGCGKDGYLYAFRGDGTQLWKSEQPFPCRIPSIADLDQDGLPEIVDVGGIIDGKTGISKGSVAAGGGYIALSDADGDGKLDIVSSSRILHADGTVVADTGISGSWNAVGDLDKDGIPEIIGANPGNHAVTIWHYDANEPGKFKVIRAGIDINTPFDPNGCGAPPAKGYPGGGPPTVADFNGDGTPDLALASGLGYVILDGKKVMDTSVPDAQTFLWTQDTQDCSSAATGSSIFDFNGDGKAEVLYSDEIQFRIYDGPTGNKLFETCNTTGTLIEYPIVADVDNDGQADIIVASNAYAFNCNGVKTSGIRVFGSKNNDWVRTRRVWNQHAYHVTNINEDGSVPAVELPNWKQQGLNNFRQNKQPGLEFAAPDVVVEVRPDCSTGNTIAMIVRNLGQSVLPPGVVVDLLKGSAPNGQLINEQVTTQALFPAQSEILTAIVDDPEVLEGLKKVYAIATFTSKVEECRTDNNTSPEVFGACAKF